jgi:phosphate-selective porin OprO/OprP
LRVVSPVVDLISFHSVYLRANRSRGCASAIIVCALFVRFASFKANGQAPMPPSPEPLSADFATSTEPATFSSQETAGIGSERSPESAPATVADLDALRAEVDKLKEAAAEARQKAEEKPLARFTQQLQLDTLAFAQDADNKAQFGLIPDGAAFRRARVGMLGDYKLTSYRIEFDFAQPGRPTFLDVWGSVNELPVLGQFKFGNFFEPFGLERLTSNRFSPFMERNLPDQPFDPQRNPGIQAMNQFADERGTWALGVFRPRTDNFGDATSFRGDWAITGRITWTPWYDEESEGRYYAHIGTAHSYRRTPFDTVTFAAQPEARLGASLPNVPFFVNTGAIQSDAYTLHGFEAAASMGSVYVQSEYFLVPVDQVAGPQLWFHGCYAQMGWFLTGEHRPYRRDTAVFDRVQPHSEFFRVRGRGGRIIQGPGAWEIAARISHLDLTSANIGGGNLTDLTVGVNWYMTPYLRFTTNYVHAFVDPAAATRSGADVFGMRLGYEF